MDVLSSSQFIVQSVFSRCYVTMMSRLERAERKLEERLSPEAARSRRHIAQTTHFTRRLCMVILTSRTVCSQGGSLIDQCKRLEGGKQHVQG